MWFKKNIKRKLFCCFILLLPSWCFAQIPMQLQQQLGGKKKLADIMNTVQAYYRLHPTDNKKANTENQGEQEAESPMIHWARWALYNSNRLNENGELTDISQRTLDALKKREQQTNSFTSSNPIWYSLGPQSTYYGSYAGRGLARVDRIAFDPTDANKMYAATPAGGLYKTTNGGASWANISAYLPTLGIADLVVSHANGNIIYILTGDGDSHLSELYNGAGFVESFGYAKKSQGVWKTTDGGISWYPTTNLDTAGTYNGYGLAQDPSNANTLLAATTKGVYRTINGGSSWTRVFDTVATAVAFQPGIGNTRAYAAGKRWVKYSTNEGATWSSSTLDNSLPNGVVRIDMATTNANDQVVYFFTSIGAVYRSSDAGVNFTRKSNSFATASDQGYYDLCIAASHTNASLINTGCLTSYRSTNDGTTMTAATNYWEVNNGVTDLNKYVHPDIHDIAYNPLNNYLYAASDGGVWRSTDEGVNWTDISTGIDAAQIYHMTARTTNADTLLCGMQDNGINLRQGFINSFRHLASGDGFSTALKPGIDGEGFCSINTSIYRISNDYGTVSSVLVTNPAQWYPNVMVSPVDPELAFAGYFYINQRTSNISGWSVNTGGKGNNAMANCPSNASRFYAAGGDDAWATNGRLYITSNTGTNWGQSFTGTNSGFPLQAGRPRLTDIGVDPTNSDHVWCSFAGYDTVTKVYYSPNAGANWVNLTDGLPNVPVNSLAIDNNNNCYAGTDLGVYYRDLNRNYWQPYYNELPMVPITDIIINAASNSLTVSTFGRGIWRTSLYSPCPATLNVNYELRSDQFFEASGRITGTSAVNGMAPGTTVIFRSADSIKLMPGFSVRAGDKFRGYIGSCASGAAIFKADQLPDSQKIAMPVVINNLDARMDAVIRELSVKEKNVAISYHLKTPGRIHFILTDLKRNAILSTAETLAKKGMHQESIPLGQLKKGKYYLHISLNDSITHYQELDVK